MDSATERLWATKQHVLKQLRLGRTARQIIGSLRRDWGMTRAHAEKCVGLVLVELQRDDKDETDDSKRATIIAMIHERIESATTRTRKMKIGTGENAVVVEVPFPNDDAALKAIWMLAQIYGVTKPFPLEPPNVLPANTPKP